MAKSISLILLVAAMLLAAVASPPGERGSILDREGRVLAEGEPAYRLYPFDSLASHLTGFVCRARSRPEDKREGRAGVEKTGEMTLRSGRDLHLTIDLEKQFVVEAVLRESGVGRGAAVVVDPANGDVLAMASVPSFDPNALAWGLRDEEYEELEDDRTKPLFNRALRAYPPGSVFKIVTALAAGRADHRHVCKAKLEIDDSTFRCWSRKGHGEIGFDDAFVQSCNCYFYEVGIEAGVQRLHDVASLLGLGEATGIESTYEAETFIPSEAYLLEHEIKPTLEHAANFAIGQPPVTATPAHLATVAATFANGGILHPPRLLLGREPAEPVDVASNVNKALFGRVRKLMREVVNDPRGTAGRGKSGVFTIAGKTGTAQWLSDGEWQYVGHFIGFAPFETPRYAFCVSIEGAESGGGVCAPVAKKILERFAKIDAGERVEIKPLRPAVGHLDRIGRID